MSEPRTRGVSRVVGCAGAVLLSLVLGVVVLRSCHPVARVFVSELRIRNDSGVTVWVTPIGMWEGRGRIGPLPRLTPALWMWRHPRQTRLRLDPGESVRILYDWDDINFRHILVRDAAGVVRILDTDRKGNLGNCYRAQRDTYVIPALKMLRLAPAELHPCEKGKAVDYPPLRIEYPDIVIPRG